MDFYLGRSDWKTLQRGEEHSFLLVNGLGGYCSQTVICSNARHDHNLLTAALVAPTKRFAMVRRIEEILHVGSNAYRLDSQAYVTSSDDAAGFRFLDSFFYDGLPEKKSIQAQRQAYVAKYPSQAKAVNSLTGVFEVSLFIV